MKPPGEGKRGPEAGPPPPRAPRAAQVAYAVHRGPVQVWFYVFVGDISRPPLRVRRFLLPGGWVLGGGEVWPGLQSL